MTPIQHLGKYDILEELGRGGFGTVYRALDTTLKREVALKVFNPALLHEAGWLARFQREAQFIAALEHPRIVTVYEIAEAENRVFIAMKLLRGPSLDKVLAERGALPWEEARRITLEVAEALTFAHAQGVLHRDLKPANIVLDAATGAVLTDFGFARLMGDTSLSLSVSGGLVGTPHYIAPELWQNQQASPASDLYALGCILYEMVLGRKAFPGDTSPAVMMAHFQPLALPKAWPKGTPPGLAEVLRQCLAQAPEARTPTLAAFVDAVRALRVDPLAEPYAALEQAVKAGEWEQARQIAEAIHAQDPAYRDTAQALEKAKAEIARAELIAQWRAQTEAALKAGQLMAARAAAEQWLRLAPEDGKAQAALAQVETTLAEAVRQKQAAENAATAEARERERRQAEVESRRADEAAAQKETAAEAARKQQEVEAAERQRVQAVQVAQSQPHTPPQQPVQRQTTQKKAFPVWAWALLGIVGLAGLIWGLSQGGGGATPTPERVVVTVVVTEEVVQVVTATPSPEPEAAETAEPTEAPTTTSGTHALGDTWTRPADDMVMVYVPAGEFQMGDTWYDEVKPVHTVALDSFWIDRTEVSVAQFQKFVSATGYETTAEQQGWSFALVGSAVVEEGDWKHPEGPNSQAVNSHPVVHVSWDDAVAYCEWAGARLPTEAEWEYAARGPEELAFPWGNAFDGTRSNFCDESCPLHWADKSVDDGYKFTAPVGSYPDGASWVGALDLAGNVWEWVADWYGSYPFGRQVNPTGPQSGEYRVLRGGSWGTGGWDTRGAYRVQCPPTFPGDSDGFRCGLSVAPRQ